MFIKYEYIRRVSPEIIPINGRSKFLFRVVDDDFDITDTIVSNSWFDAIASVYEKRNLNVPKNTFIAIKHFSRIISGGIDATIYQLKKYSTEYRKYEKDIQKYLLLL